MNGPTRTSRAKAPQSKQYSKQYSKRYSKQNRASYHGNTRQFDSIIESYETMLKEELFPEHSNGDLVFTGIKFEVNGVLTFVPQWKGSANDMQNILESGDFQRYGFCFRKKESNEESTWITGYCEPTVGDEIRCTVRKYISLAEALNSRCGEFTDADLHTSYVKPKIRHERVQNHVNTYNRFDAFAAENDNLDSGEDDNSGEDDDSGEDDGFDEKDKDNEEDKDGKSDEDDEDDEDGEDDEDVKMTKSVKRHMWRKSHTPRETRYDHIIKNWKAAIKTARGRRRRMLFTHLLMLKMVEDGKAQIVRLIKHSKVLDESLKIGRTSKHRYYRERIFRVICGARVSAARCYHYIINRMNRSYNSRLGPATELKTLVAPEKILKTGENIESYIIKHCIDPLMLQIADRFLTLRTICIRQLIDEGSIDESAYELHPAPNSRGKQHAKICERMITLLLNENSRAEFVTLIRNEKNREKRFVPHYEWMHNSSAEDKYAKMIAFMGQGIVNNIRSGVEGWEACMNIHVFDYASPAQKEKLTLRRAMAFVRQRFNTVEYYKKRFAMMKANDIIKRMWEGLLDNASHEEGRTQYIEPKHYYNRQVFLARSMGYIGPQIPSEIGYWSNDLRIGGVAPEEIDRLKCRASEIMIAMEGNGESFVCENNPTLLSLNAVQRIGFTPEQIHICRVAALKYPTSNTSWAMHTKQQQTMLEVLFRDRLRVFAIMKELNSRRKKGLNRTVISRTSRRKLNFVYSISVDTMENWNIDKDNVVASGFSSFWELAEFVWGSKCGEYLDRMYKNEKISKSEHSDQKAIWAGRTSQKWGGVFAARDSNWLNVKEWSELTVGDVMGAKNNTNADSNSLLSYHFPHFCGIKDAFNCWFNRPIQDKIIPSFHTMDKIVRFLFRSSGFLASQPRLLERYKTILTRHIKDRVPSLTKKQAAGLIKELRHPSLIHSQYDYVKLQIFTDVSDITPIQFPTSALRIAYRRDDWTDKQIEYFGGQLIGHGRNIYRFGDFEFAMRSAYMRNVEYLNRTGSDLAKIMSIGALVVSDGPEWFKPNCDCDYGKCITKQDAKKRNAAPCIWVGVNVYNHSKISTSMLSPEWYLSRQRNQSLHDCFVEQMGRGAIRLLGEIGMDVYNTDLNDADTKRNILKSMRDISRVWDAQSSIGQKLQEKHSTHPHFSTMAEYDKSPNSTLGIIYDVINKSHMKFQKCSPRVKITGENRNTRIPIMESLLLDAMREIEKRTGYSYNSELIGELANSFVRGAITPGEQDENGLKITRKRAACSQLKSLKKEVATVNYVISKLMNEAQFDERWLERITRALWIMTHTSFGDTAKYWINQGISLYSTVNKLLLAGDFGEYIMRLALSGDGFISVFYSIIYGDHEEAAHVEIAQNDLNNRLKQAALREIDRKFVDEKKAAKKAIKNINWEEGAANSVYEEKKEKLNADREEILANPPQAELGAVRQLNKFARTRRNRAAKNHVMRSRREYCTH